jgi:hypothetical protein
MQGAFLKGRVTHRLKQPVLNYAAIIDRFET